MARAKTKLDGECPRYVIEPLKEGYKTVTERTTTLWGYMCCAYKQKYRPQTPWTKHYFRIGHQINAVCQTYLSNGSDISFLYPRDFEQKQLRKYIKAVKEWLAEKYDFVTNEHDLSVEVEMGDYLVCVTWTPDLIMSEGTDTIMVDLKTSSSEWDEDKKSQQRQKYVYPFLWNLNHPAYPIKRFEYFLMTTHSEPRVYSYEYECDNKIISEKVEKVLKNYIKNIEWTPETTPWIACRGCPLLDICPAHNPNPF